MAGDNLYHEVKSRICDLIYEGVYQEGERIPSERLLATQLGVSRVTLRKALELLEDDQLIQKEQGSGSRVCFHNYGARTALDTVVLIAPAMNPFFADFIKAFQRASERLEALVLYVEKPVSRGLEDCLYRLYCKGHRNAVIWLEDLLVDSDKLKRLRALGMNLVFFDTDAGLPYGDCVILDNDHAVSSLCKVLKSRGAERIGYIGWDRLEVCSIRQREEAFVRQAGEGQMLLRLPWSRHMDCGAYLEEIAADQAIVWPDSIICGDRETGSGLARILDRRKSQIGGQEIPHILLAAVDEFPEAEELDVIVCCQDMTEFSNHIMERLMGQSSQKEDWKASLIKIKGRLPRT